MEDRLTRYGEGGRGVGHRMVRINGEEDSKVEVRKVGRLRLTMSVNISRVKLGLENIHCFPGLLSATPKSRDIYRPCPLPLGDLLYDPGLAMLIPLGWTKKGARLSCTMR